MVRDQAQRHELAALPTPEHSAQHLLVFMKLFRPVSVLKGVPMTASQARSKLRRSWNPKAAVCWVVDLLVGLPVAVVWFVFYRWSPGPP